MLIKDKIWLWGQTEGSHHDRGNPYKLFGVNKMTPVEGAKYLGITNMCRVVMGGLPALPFDNEANLLDEMDKVIWSIVGSSGSEDSDTLDEIIRLSKTHDNMFGGVLDDFFIPRRMEKYSPDSLAKMRERLHNEPPHPLELWSVFYERWIRSEADIEQLKPYLVECDAVSFWTWYGQNILNLEENIATLKENIGKDKRIILGVYMWDYGNGKPLSDELMNFQLVFAYKKLKAKEIDGIIICSNCIADLGLKAVEITKEWINIYGDEPLL